MWNMFKTNNEDTRTTLMTLFWYIYCELWTYFTPFSSASIVTLNRHMLTGIYLCQCYTYFPLMCTSYMEISAQIVSVKNAVFVINWMRFSSGSLVKVGYRFKRNFKKLSLSTCVILNDRSAFSFWSKLFCKC